MFFLIFSALRVNAQVDQPTPLILPSVASPSQSLWFHLSFGLSKAQAKLDLLKKITRILL